MIDWAPPSSRAEHICPGNDASALRQEMQGSNGADRPDDIHVTAVGDASV